jgi:flagellar biogenesis protein FliO
MTAAVTRTVRRAAYLLLVLIAIEVMLPAFVRAQAADTIGTAVPSYGILDWLNLGFRLTLVIGAIWVAVVGMRWYVKRVNGDGPRLGRQVQVLESRTLGPNRSLQLVRLGGRAVLLGVTAERINPLITIEDTEEVERLVEAATAVQPNPLRQFSGIASASLNRLAKPQQQGGSAASLAARPTTLARALEWLNPMPPKRTRPQYRTAGAAGVPARAMPMAAQRARAASAYGQESALAAAQRAIASAQGQN